MNIRISVYHEYGYTVYPYLNCILSNTVYNTQYRLVENENVLSCLKLIRRVGNKNVDSHD